MKSLIGRAAAIALFVFASQSALARDLGYDPKADPFEQYHAAIELAEREHKLVLVIAGGDWCTWCHVLDRFVSNDDEVERRLHEPTSASTTITTCSSRNCRRPLARHTSGSFRPSGKFSRRSPRRNWKRERRDTTSKHSSISSRIGKRKPIRRRLGASPLDEACVPKAHGYDIRARLSPHALRGESRWQ
jgi:hypothetical protein